MLTDVSLLPDTKQGGQNNWHHAPFRRTIYSAKSLEFRKFDFFAYPFGRFYRLGIVMLETFGLV